MGLFSRKTPPAALPAPEEVAAAGRALQVDGDRGPADRLADQAGPHRQAVAMAILAAAADHQPNPDHT